MSEIDSKMLAGGGWMTKDHRGGWRTKRWGGTGEGREEE
jgi:hypothetical protein